MVKILLICMLFYSASSVSQINYNDLNIKNISPDNSKQKESGFKNSFSINISPALFIPVKMYQDKLVGIGFNIGLQWNFSEKTSLCVDFDAAYTKETFEYYDYYYRTTISNSYWKSYLQLECGPKFYFPNGEKLKFFVSPEIGIFVFRHGGNNYSNQSTLPLSFSFEIGVQYSLTKKLSAILKVKNSLQPQIGFAGGEMTDFLLINGGLSYQF